MTQKKITLFNFGHFDNDLLSEVGAVAGKEFDAVFTFRKEYVDLSEFFDSSRKQYNGNKLLAFVDQRAGFEQGKLIGLFSVDIFIPILTYIYGQAYLNGKSAIASAHRLSNERYGLARDEKVFLSRLIKEVNHELGHCYGLIHCHTPGCVMQSSTYVEDIDQKNMHFCDSCLLLVRNARDS